MNGATPLTYLRYMIRPLVDQIDHFWVEGVSTSSDTTTSFVAGRSLSSIRMLHHLGMQGSRSHATSYHPVLYKICNSRVDNRGTWSSRLVAYTATLYWRLPRAREAAARPWEPEGEPPALTDHPGYVDLGGGCYELTL